VPDVSHAGGCLCGAVRYAAAGTPWNLCYCHCQSCRRAAGAPSVPWGTFARGQFHVSHGQLAEYRSSAHAIRGFCSCCGTALTYRTELRPEEIDVTLVSLDEPARFPPQMHVWVADKVPWVLISDGLPQHAAGGG